MLEWLKRHAWKACILQKSIGGSNPPLSAKHLKLSAQRWAFSVQGRQELAPVRTCTEKAQGRKAMSFKSFARAPAASGKGKAPLCVANPYPPSPARFKRRVWKSYRVSPNFKPTASEIIRKVESCMSVSPFSRRATYSLFLPILSASCC